MGSMALGAVMLVLVARAPAMWLDLAVAAWTHGQVRLADVAGTVWSGQGRIVLADDAGARRRSAGPVVTGMVIPGVFRWQVSPGWLCVGRIRAQWAHDSMVAPVHVTGNWQHVQITGGRLALPALALDRLGSPWNTIRPFGSLQVFWDALNVRKGAWDGRVRLVLTDLASALTPVRPLGAYQIELTADGAQGVVRMDTLKGPLRLEGDGTWSAQRGLQGMVSAQADAVEHARLMPLLRLLGRRQGERTMIKIGA